MKQQLFDTQIHIATGGRPFSKDGEALVLLHGSGQNHLTWVLQSRYFAYRGYRFWHLISRGMAYLAARHWNRSKIWLIG